MRKRNYVFSVPIAVLLAVGLAFGGGSVATSDLPSDWSARAYEKIRESEYRVTPRPTAAGGDILQAPNRANGFRTWFGQDGIRVVPRVAEAPDWELVLHFSGLRRADDTEPASAAIPVADAETVTYTRERSVERYVNDGDGLTQVLTIFAPEGDDAGSVEALLEVGGSMKARVDAATDAIEFGAADGRVGLRFAVVEAVDASGNALEVRTQYRERRGLGEISIEISDGHDDYPVTVRSILTLDDLELAPDDSGRFGFSVGGAGDVNGDGHADVIIAAPEYDVTDAENGRVFVYYGNASGLPSVANWTESGTRAFEYFGWSVGTAGDVNGDGFDDVIIGAPGHNDQFVRQGAAMVYLGSAAGLETARSWIAFGIQFASEFGTAVATAGDVNGDGFDDVIVGEPRADFGAAVEAGRVTVYHGSPAGLSTSLDWVATGDEEDARLGAAVSTAGDVDGDGDDEVLVGVPKADAWPLTLAGRVDLYAGAPTGLGSNPAWTVIGTRNGGYGTSVAPAGDVNGDGFDDFIVGESGGGGLSRVFVYHGSPGHLTEDASWIVTQNIHGFGASVAGAGDLNDDGYDEVIIGAPFVDSVYAYRGSPEGLVAEVFFIVTTGRSTESFGYSVDGVGDIDADGHDDIVIGEPYVQWMGVHWGRATVVFGPGPCDTDGDGLCVPEDCDGGNPNCATDCTDADGDGYCVDFDCDDANPTCDADCADADGDGYCVNFDCDDANPNCDADCTDTDGDGYCVTTDCYDQSADCTTLCVDEDGDGLPPCAGDCDDSKPGCTTDCTDADADGYCVGHDCDESDPDCSVDCTDFDGDGYCVDLDCYDFSVECTTGCTDEDGDGVPVCANDCDDSDPLCGRSCVDLDGDGWCRFVDCDDAKPNCGADCTDADGDQYCDDDCNDFNPNCILDCTDADSDLFCADFDCDESNPNCSSDCTDADGDGYCVTTDCFDQSADCTTDCSGDTDDDLVPTCGDCDDLLPFCRLDCTDADGDGLCVDFDCDDSTEFCLFSCANTDGDAYCNEFDCDNLNPHCTSDCTDTDGDGYCVPEDCDETSVLCNTDCTDVDEDGWCITSDCDDALAVCTDNCEDADDDGLGACYGDCDDNNPDALPGLVEVCTDDADNDCNGFKDDTDEVCLGLLASALEFTDRAPATLAWAAATEADTHAVYRGRIPTTGLGGYNHLCEAAQLEGTTLVDEDVPPSGEGFYYLVMGQTMVTGPPEQFKAGPLGRASNDASRPDSSWVTCGPRIHVDPDVVVGSNDGLNWATAYTGVSGALNHPGFADRGIEIWIRGSVPDSGVRLENTVRGAARLLGGFDGTEIDPWEREPETSPSIWDIGGTNWAVRTSGSSIVLDGFTIRNGVTGVLGAPAGAWTELTDVRTEQISGYGLDLEVETSGESSLLVQQSLFGGLGAGGVRTVARAGLLTGRIRRNLFEGGSEAALWLEARPDDAMAEVRLDVVGNTITGGQTGLMLQSDVYLESQTGLQTSFVGSNMIYGTTGSPLVVEAAGRFNLGVGPALSEARPLIVGNTLSDGGAAGVLVNATLIGPETDHVVRSEPELWDNLITYNAGAGIEESGTDLLSNPLVVGNGLHGNLSLYLDEGMTELTDIEDVNALEGAYDNFVGDPLYLDRFAGDYHLDFGTALGIGSAMRYLANETDPGLGMDWALRGFDDAGWSPGEYGIGYDAEGDAADLLATQVPVGTLSVYTRLEFALHDLGEVETVTLGADFDDGYVAWLNGVEIYRSPSMPGGALSWDTAPSEHECSNGALPTYEEVDVTALALTALQTGNNVFAVAVWNESAASPDLVLVPLLRLNDDQPAIDSGHPEAPRQATEDIDGGPRVSDGDRDGVNLPDAGADER